MSIYKIKSNSLSALGVHYEVDVEKSPLGSGGMGQVFKGVRVDENTGIKTDVAVKFLYQDLPESAIRRSRCEASIQIKNENLIEMMGFIEMDDRDRSGNVVKRNFIVSEFLQGVMLYELLQGKTTDINGETVEYAEELYALCANDRVQFAKLVVSNILAGVMALHDRGYIHRDIDPSNIMITVDRKIKLIDFGIAKKVKESFNNTQSLTKFGSFVGKPSYAAPELITGDVSAHNYSTDLYQVGVLLYELMVGTRPFTGAEHEVMNMQINSPVPIENVSHAGIAQIIKKAMNKSQSDRYNSAAQFKADIENCENLVVENKGQGVKNDLLLWGSLYAAAAIAGVLLGLFI
jgi:serine/threonine-protein kinase